MLMTASGSGCGLPHRSERCLPIGRWRTRSCPKCPEHNSHTKWFLLDRPKSQSGEGFRGQGSEDRIAKPLGKKLSNWGRTERKAKGKTEDPLQSAKATLEGPHVIFTDSQTWVQEGRLDERRWLAQMSQKCLHHTFTKNILSCLMYF